MPQNAWGWAPLTCLWQVAFMVVLPPSIAWKLRFHGDSAHPLPNLKSSFHDSLLFWTIAPAMQAEWRNIRRPVFLESKHVKARRIEQALAGLTYQIRKLKQSLCSRIARSAPKALFSTALGLSSPYGMSIMRALPEWWWSYTFQWKICQSKEVKNENCRRTRGPEVDVQRPLSKKNLKHVTICHPFSSSQ